MNRAVLLFCWLVLMPAYAAPDVVFGTSPEATVYEGDRPLASGGAFRLTLDPGTPHRLRVTRPPYDDLWLTLTWQGAWKMDLGVRSLLLEGDGPRLELTRTMRFDVSPRDAMVYRDVDFGSTTGEPVQAEDVTIAGLRHRLVPLPHTADDRWIVPAAAAPPALYFLHPRFEPYTLLLARGALDGTPPRVAMTPLYGWFSYRNFDMACGLVALSIVGLWALVARPRQTAKRRQEREDRALARAVREASVHGPGRTQASSWLIGSMVAGEGGSSFVVQRELGQGGMGAVYEVARCPLSSGPPDLWAMKILRQFGAAAPARFRRELDVLRTLQHPGIVTVLDWGTLPNEAGLFIIMELVRGSDLSQVIASRKALPVEEALRLAADVLQALKVAHEAGVIHRDIKPSNIMVTPSGKTKLLDFGIARVAEGSMTQSDAILGSPFYMSPEHFNANSVTPASDLFSVGVVLYEMLTGTNPWIAAQESDDLALSLLYRIARQDYPSLTTVPVDVARIVHTLLQADPSLRYQTAAAVLTDLHEALS